MSAFARLTEGRHYDIDDTGCWVWKLSLSKYGYGKAAKGAAAHRRSYTENVGSLEASQHLDHICRNRACINPAHLEIVTNAENNRRGRVARGFISEPGKCGHGHDMTDPYVEPNTGKHVCRECRRTWALAWYYRQQAAA